MAPRRTVAVVAVHGVADQVPGATARQIGNLLADLGRPATARYSAFEEETLRIPVRPLELSRPADAAGGTRRFCERSQALRHGRSTVKPDMEFLRGQLSEYRGEGPADTYDTVRLRARREGADLDVHVYELFWADLSRLGGTAFAIFGELYQILFHVANLGSHAISAASIGDRLPGPWDWWIRLQRAAAWVLAGPVAMLNLAFIWTALVMLTAALPLGLHLPVAIGVAAVSLAWVAIRVFPQRPALGLLVWMLGVVGTGLGAWAIWSPTKRLSMWLALEAVAVGVAAIGHLTARYARGQPELRWV